MHIASSCSGNGYLATFAAGALLGAGTALVLAPHTGKETRDLIAQRTKELKHSTEDVFTQTAELLRKRKDQVVAALEAGREAMREAEAKPHVPA